MMQLACIIKEKINTRHHHFLTFRNGQKERSRHIVEKKHAFVLLIWH